MSSSLHLPYQLVESSLVEGRARRVGELLHQGAAARPALGRAPSPDLQTLIPALKVVAVTCRPPQTVSFKAALKVAVVMRHPPRTVSFKVVLKVVVVMRQDAETMRRLAGWMVDERRLP
jgi:hypothetical protein